MADTPAPDTPHEDIEALLSDYHDGLLPAAERERVKAHLTGCAACRAAYAELEETMAALSGMKGQKPVAPADLTARVTETIHRRSAGRFFGKKTLGDRVPFGVLLIVALIVLGVTAAILWSSTTGGLGKRPTSSPPGPGSGHVVAP